MASHTRYTTAFTGLGNLIRLRSWYHFVKAGPNNAPDKIKHELLCQYRTAYTSIKSEASSAHELQR